MNIERGSDRIDRKVAASLFWDAFKDKLNVCMGPEEKALSFLEDNICPRFSFAAYDGDLLLGLIGFKTPNGGLMGGNFHDLRHVYGFFSSLWRAVILSMFERKLKPHQLLLDGIFVAPEARGKGVGSGLIEAIRTMAIEEGFSEIRLDVIDNNPRAKQLYERLGFQSVGTVSAGFLEGVLGFKSATTMVLKL